MECNVKHIFLALVFIPFVLSARPRTLYEDVYVQPMNYILEINTTQQHFEDSNNTPVWFDGKLTLYFRRIRYANFSEDEKDNLQVILDTNPETVIRSLVLEGVDGEGASPINAKFERKKDKLIIIYPKRHAEVRYFRLNVVYSNPLGNDGTGFYRSSYKDTDGKTRWFLTTHFERCFARKAFPCFDEPFQKARFEIHITAPKSITTVISNTGLDKKVEQKNSIKYIFKVTPMDIPTYLVSFTAANFTSTNSVVFQSPYNIHKYTLTRNLTTYGRKDIINSGRAEFAQAIAKKAVDTLTKYLGFGYAFEKIDQIGIPGFPKVALENWGHLSYREKSLFFNTSQDSAATKQAIALTVTHELVHQWFGNLITIQHWGWSFLNKGIATYLQYLIASEFEETSKWNLKNQMVVNEIHLRAFETDAYFPPALEMSQFHELYYILYNDIFFSKGAAVFRMWNLGLPKGIFQTALSKYINNRKEDYTSPDRLYEDLYDVTRMTKQQFYGWTKIAGYPVVEVKKMNGMYTLSQSRFFWVNTTLARSWSIPITYTTDKVTNSTINWLEKASDNLIAPGKWIIINNDQVGYYRVNYDKENWEALSDALKASEHSKISELNRAQIINDVFSLARSLQKEYVSYTTAFELAKYLEKENSYVPWKTALNVLEYIKNRIYDEEIYKKFKNFVISLIKPHFKTLNSTSMDHIDKLKNVEISRWACSLDFLPCVGEAKDIFSKSAYSKLPDTQEIILCTVVRSDKTAWDLIWKKYQEEEDSALRLMYISALGCGARKSQISMLLYNTLKDDSSIPVQDRLSVLSSVYNGNVKNIELAFDFIEHFYVSIVKKYGGIIALQKSLIGIAKKLKTQDHFNRLQRLTIDINSDPELRPEYIYMDHHLSIAVANVWWTDKKLKQLKDYFSKISVLS